MVTYAKISPKNGEPQRYSWGMQKKKKKSYLQHILKKPCFPQEETLTRRELLAFFSVWFACPSLEILTLI